VNVRVKPRATAVKRDLPFECIALVLQGGGALGAYQAGVYEALAEAGIYPDRVTGISIGAINCAIIAGNPPEARIEKLRGFWECITTNPWRSSFEWTNRPTGDAARAWLNQLHAGLAVVAGTAGFFAPRYPPPWLYASGTANATSFYDTCQLRDTLERFVDFDRLNAGAIRLSIGAVNVRSGNFVYFDTQTHTIGPEHITASAALPPVSLRSRLKGSIIGMVVSNTPLQWIVESRPRLDTLAFQVDLWSARGALPRNLAEVSTRQKDIQYSSRTRAGTDSFKRIQRLRRAAADLLDKLPDDLRRSPEAALLRNVVDRKVYNIVHLICRGKNYEGPAKDYEFSRESMKEHWRAGYNDAIRTLRHPEVVGRPANDEGVFTFDLAVDGRE
jgi:NTE family protein